MFNKKCEMLNNIILYIKSNKENLPPNIAFNGKTFKPNKLFLKNCMSEFKKMAGGL